MLIPTFISLVYGRYLFLCLKQCLGLQDHQETFTCQLSSRNKILWSLGKDDGGSNKNGKKAIGLDWQNNNFACVSCFFEHFFAVAA